MKNVFPLATALLLLFAGISSCKKNNNTSPTASPQYNMQFTISASGSPLYMNHTVTNVPFRYYLKQLRFYVGFAKLEKSDGTEVPLSNLFIVAYDSNNAYNSIYGRNFNFAVPAGSY